MKRRKFLIGLGSIAAGGAAVMGTGALEATRAKRTLSIDVAGDGAAYLGLIPNTDSQFVYTDNGAIGIDLASDSGEGGSGVNNDASTVVRPAFRIRNQGSRKIYTEIDNPLRNTDITSPQTNQVEADGNLGFTVPAGLDVQFVASSSLPVGSVPKSEVGLVGRDEVPASSLGGEFDDIDSNEYFAPVSNGPAPTNAGTRIQYSNAAGAGYLGLEPGEEVPITLNVVANDVDIDEVSNISSKALVEAFTSTDPLTYDPEVVTD